MHVYSSLPTLKTASLRTVSNASFALAFTRLYTSVYLYQCSCVHALPRIYILTKIPSRSIANYKLTE